MVNQSKPKYIHTIFCIKFFTLFCLLSFIADCVFAQYKEQAVEQFKQEHYNESIALLEKQLLITPNDAETYYYLGWFNHYRAYDSRPLKGYDINYSEKILSYLDKAIELDSTMGDAKYFYGAECSANVFVSMQDRDANKVKYYHNLAYSKGAYPAWMIEYGENILKACETNAILFTAGNADYDVCAYLQVCRNFRQDVTLIPLGMIERAWYIKLLKSGLDSVLLPIHLTLTDNQIMELRPFKWRPTQVVIPLSEQHRMTYDIADTCQFSITIEPDLQSQRIDMKMIDGSTQSRPLLSPQRAILLQIIEDNYDSRPIYFSNSADKIMYGGFDSYFQDCGFVSKLLPLKTQDTEYQFDIASMEQTIHNTSNCPDIMVHKLPRTTPPVYYGYINLAYMLKYYYIQNDQIDKVQQLNNLFKKNLQIGIDNQYEEQFFSEEEFVK